MPVSAGPGMPGGAVVANKQTVKMRSSQLDRRRDVP
jgi:hypothetical protein